MKSTHPSFPVKIVPIVPIGDYTHAIINCPRCGRNIGVTARMMAGQESIICEGSRNDLRCGGHYYLRNKKLEFIGTVKNG